MAAAEIHLLAMLGIATIAVLLLAILKRWLSPLVALIVIPVTAALLGGFATEVDTFIVDGIRAVAPMAAMFVFAIIFFGVMSDAGLFAPFVNAVLNVVGKNPPRILVGTVILTSVVHLDGSGATTFLITIPALRPLYDELGMDRRKLACCVALGAGVNNMLPWGGPTIRAATALNVDVMDVYGPLVPVHLTGLTFAIFCAFAMGVMEKKRLGQSSAAGATLPTLSAGTAVPLVPWWQFAVNIAITLLVIGTMITGFVHPAVAFMLGVVAAMTVNYPKVEQQRERVDAHAKAALLMASILFAAGAFTGIMNGSGMLHAMASAGTELIPVAAAAQLPLILSLISMPLSLVFDPDSFYFGVLPILAHVGEAAGATQLQVAQAALIGQMTTGFPISPLTPTTFLLVGLAGVDLASHQRFTIPWLFATSMVMVIAASLLGLLLV